MFPSSNSFQGSHQSMPTQPSPDLRPYSEIHEASSFPQPQLVHPNFYASMQPQVSRAPSFVQQLASSLQQGQLPSSLHIPQEDNTQPRTVEMSQENWEQINSLFGRISDQIVRQSARILELGNEADTFRSQFEHALQSAAQQAKEKETCISLLTEHVERLKKEKKELEADFDQRVHELTSQQNKNHKLVQANGILIKRNKSMLQTNRELKEKTQALEETINRLKEQIAQQVWKEARAQSSNSSAPHNDGNPVYKRSRSVPSRDD